MKKKPEKDEKKSESMCVRRRSSRIVDHNLVMPPSLPMVFSVRSYVRVVRMPPFGRGGDRGRIASLTPDQPDCYAVE